MRKRSLLFLLAVSFIFISSCSQQEEVQSPKAEQPSPKTAHPTSQATPPASATISLGNLCSNEDDCRDFCLDNRGRCEQYCSDYPENVVCQKLFSPQGFYTEKLSPEKPVLENIGFNLDFYDPATGNAGDILFVNKIDDHFNHKIFLEFAHKIVGHEGSEILPHPTYFLPLGTKLISPVNGVIDAVTYQDRDKDYEIGITPDSFSKWIVSFDHIINLKVEEGDRVSAGDVVGEVAQRNSPAIPPELGWTELQIWEADAPAICPFLLLNTSVKADIEAKITQLAEDWEEFIGKDVYSQENWISPGCLAETAKG